MGDLPGPRGPAVLDTTARFAARPHRTLLELHARHGPVVEFGTGPGRLVAVFGPEANAHLFGHDDLFSQREMFDTVAPLSGETALLLSHGDEHRRRRRVAATGFTRGAVAGYVPAFTAHADHVIDGWRPGDRVDLHREFRTVIRRATVEVLFGPDLAGEADRIGAMLDPLLRFVEGDPVSQQLHRALGTRRWRRALAGRRGVDDLVRAELARRDGAPRTDLLARFATPAEGVELSGSEVVDQVVSLVVAAYETTAAATAWACLTLLTAPAVAERVRAEVTTACGDAPPTAEDLPRLPFTGRVVHETLRLYPPASISGRYVRHGFALHGHDIPPGTRLIFSPFVTHRDPAVWDRPTTFLPQRWDDADPAHRRPGPGAYVPFGGGAHRCLGAALAVAELTVLLARMVVRTDLTPVPQPVRPSGFLAMRPRDGVPAVVRAVR